ncbi:hypothetical protein F4782DRAFT_253957 [Xylaria castorea]|nr:hypothetical protein F4782DRAFT_253957 [Xylaria castorea]
MAGTARSCTACRQAKVGCDARRKPINTPCTRCDKNRIECRFDKNFKRILTRNSHGYGARLTANLTNELHQLRVSQAQAVSEGSKSSPLDTQLRELEAEASPTHVPFFFANVTEPLSDFRIGNVTITPKTVIELIQHFGDQYYVCAHFVKPIESLAVFHAVSPLLFWTIILVASQYHEAHSGLYEQLLSPYEELLRPFSNTAIQSIHEIHALLLLCLWPVPNRPEAISPTWNYISLAVGACIRLNLDKAASPNSVEPPRSNVPSYQRRLEEAGMQIQRLTWLACLAITTQEATFLGLLPPFSSRFYQKRSRRAVDELKDYLLPGFTPKFTISQIMCNYNLVLEEVDSSSAQLSLVETFNSALDRVWQTYSAEWSINVDVLLQYAKLSLIATALIQILIENETTCSPHHTDIQILIIQGSEAASRLISDMKTMTSEALANEGKPGNIMPIYYPRFYFGVLFFAAVFIFRVSYMKPSIDHDAAVEGLIEVSNIFRLFPRHSDLKVGLDMIQHILRYARSEEFLSSPTSSLTTTNRLGASFIWDTLRRTAQFTGEEKPAGQADNEHQAPRATHDTVAGSSPTTQNTIMHDTSDLTSDVASTLPLPINLDWGDIDLSFPTFDIFGLEAGEHII